MIISYVTNIPHADNNYPKLGQYIDPLFELHLLVLQFPQIAD